jgi:hypothetical protein
MTTTTKIAPALMILGTAAIPASNKMSSANAVFDLINYRQWD